MYSSGGFRGAMTPDAVLLVTQKGSHV